MTSAHCESPVGSPRGYNIAPTKARRQEVLVPGSQLVRSLPERGTDDDQMVTRLQIPRRGIRGSRAGDSFTADLSVGGLEELCPRSQ
jgi:hypothetical protein